MGQYFWIKRKQNCVVSDLILDVDVVGFFCLINFHVNTLIILNWKHWEMLPLVFVSTKICSTLSRSFSCPKAFIKAHNSVRSFRFANPLRDLLYCQNCIQHLRLNERQAFFCLCVAVCCCVLILLFGMRSYSRSAGKNRSILSVWNY